MMGSYPIMLLQTCLEVERDHFTVISAQTNFTIEGLALTLFGRCANCRA
jgi:hypothetical protein